MQLLSLEESLCASVCCGNYHSPIHIHLQESLLSSLIVPQAALSEAWTELRLFWRRRDLHSYTNIRGILTSQRAQVTAFSLQEFASVPSTVLGTTWLQRNDTTRSLCLLGSHGLFREISCTWKIAHTGQQHPLTPPALSSSSRHAAGVC